MVIHPILRRAIVRADGTATIGLHVYCTLQDTSVPVGRCCACARCREVSCGDCPAVTCSATRDPADAERAQRAAGTAVQRGVICVENDVTARALAQLVAAGAHVVPVVSASGAVMGVVHESRLVNPLVRADALAGEIMSSALAVEESAPIDIVLRALAMAHLREITVVSPGGVPLGVLRDVDALRAFATTRSEASVTGTPDVPSDASAAGARKRRP